MPIITHCFYYIVSLHFRAIQQIPLQFCKKWGDRHERREKRKNTLKSCLLKKLITNFLLEDAFLHKPEGIGSEKYRYEDEPGNVPEAGLQMTE